MPWTARFLNQPLLSLLFLAAFLQPCKAQTFGAIAGHPGFKQARSNNVQLQVEQALRQDFTFQIGQVSETVEVSAQAQQLQSENSTAGSVIENQQIEQLPLNGRQYLNLVALSPNTNTLSPPAGQAQSRQGGDRANQSISVGGQRIMFDYYTPDGVNNTDPDFNSYVVLPSIDALQEFKVQTGVYPAEYGHEATQVNVMTKSGGNNYHGVRRVHEIAVVRKK
jgi:hypothetical protein